MKNWKYYLLYPIILPFILLDKLIFFEIESTRIWDDSIWLHRVLLWHDNLYHHYEDPLTEHFDGKEVYHHNGKFDPALTQKHVVTGFPDNYDPYHICTTETDRGYHNHNEKRTE